MSCESLAKASDEELVALIQQGRGGRRQDALSELLSRYYQVILRMSYLSTRDKTLSLDCTQEALLAIAQSLNSFKSKSKFSTWAYSVARRSIWKSVAKHRDPRFALRDANASSVIRRTHSNSSSGQEELLISKEQHAELFRLIDSLPVKQREAVLLFYFHDISHSEIADRIGCSAQTVKAHLYKARKVLAKKLKE